MKIAAPVFQRPTGLVRNRINQPGLKQQRLSRPELVKSSTPDLGSGKKMRLHRGLDLKPLEHPALAKKTEHHPGLAKKCNTSWIA